MIDLRCGDCREELARLPAGTARTCVTSPPYFGLRDYGHAGQIGLETTPDAYVARLVEVFRAVRRVLSDDGTLWLNLGDSYASGIGGVGNCPSTRSTLTTNGGKGPKPGDKYAADRAGKGIKINPGLGSKQLLGIPWRVAFALQADGWILRSDIIWAKPNPMPESVRDRPTKAHEYLFLLSKSDRPTHWRHRDGRLVRIEPAADHRWFDRLTECETAVEPSGWREERLPDSDRRRWRRVNLWRACDYYYEADAVKELSVDSESIRGYSRKSCSDRLEDAEDKGYDGHRTRLGIKRLKTSGRTYPTRNRRSVWTIATRPYKDAHFAVFPPALIEPCILAGSARGDTVLDPFCGSGTTLAVAKVLGRDAVGIDLVPAYLDMARKRLAAAQPTALLA